MEKPRPQPSYEERLAAWQKAHSLKRRPLTDNLRAQFERGFQSGNIRVTLSEDGSVQLEKAYCTLSGGTKLYTPIDLEQGVVIADGEFQLSDSPIAPAYAQWLGEVVTRVQTGGVSPSNP